MRRLYIQLSKEFKEQNKAQKCIRLYPVLMNVMGQACRELEIKPNRLIEEAIINYLWLLGVDRSSRMIGEYNEYNMPSKCDGPIETKFPADIQLRHQRLLAGKAKLIHEFEERRRRCGNWY